MKLKKTIFILTLINLLLLPKYTFATHMPGVGDYTLLLSIVGIAGGFVIASIVVLLHNLLAKTKYTRRKYFIMWLIILLGTPAVLILLFLLIILIGSAF